MLTVKELCKTYYIESETYSVLNNISFGIKKGEFVGIMGPSGSGKTTILNTIAHFITYDSGKIMLNNRQLHLCKEDEIAEIRNAEMGFVFQDLMLLDGLTVFENVCVPQIIGGREINRMENRASELLRLFNIYQIKDKYPSSISGGQKQRVAIARALINNPLLVLADEPTGNLDSGSSQTVIDSFIAAKNNLNVTILMVTHDMNAASYCDRVLLIKDGKIYKNICKSSTKEKFINELFIETKNMEVKADESK